jgi:hypothetical protein
VSDLPRSLAFYERLGFYSRRTWGEPPCFAMPRRDGLELMLSLAEDPSRVRPNGPHGVWDVYLRVETSLPRGRPRGGGRRDRARVRKRTVYDMVEMEVVDPTDTGSASRRTRRREK